MHILDRVPSLRGAVPPAAPAGDSDPDERHLDRGARGPASALPVRARRSFRPPPADPQALTRARCARPGETSNQGEQAMATEVVKVELKNVQDASGLEAAILAGRFTADQVVAVVGKTEGNGGVNDFTRILADQAFRRVLQQHGHRSAEDIARVPMVWSGGCDGV